MKNVLLAFPYQDGETGIAIKEAFERLDCNVICVDANQQYNDLYFIHNDYGGNFDLLLTSRTEMLYEDIVRIKKKNKNIKIAVWNVDIRIPVEVWGRLLYMFEYADFYFDVNQGMEDEFKKQGIKSHYLQQGLDDRRYFPMKPTEWHKQNWWCDVGFIGNFIPNIHKDRAQKIQTLQQSGVQFRHFKDCYKDDHNYAVSCSKISLCDSVETQIKNSYSVRDWKILGGAGVAIDLWHEGIEETFNGYMESYKTVPELVSKVKHMLKNYDEYKAKAYKAAKWCKESQTYYHRMKEMLEVCFG
jgi:hypothetical protein